MDLKKLVSKGRRIKDSDLEKLVKGLTIGKKRKRKTVKKRVARKTPKRRTVAKKTTRVRKSAPSISSPPSFSWPWKSSEKSVASTPRLTTYETVGRARLNNPFSDSASQPLRVVHTQQAYPKGFVPAQAPSLEHPFGIASQMWPVGPNQSLDAYMVKGRARNPETA